MVVLGQISAPFGIRGWLKIYPLTAQLDGLLAYPSWWLGRDGAAWRECRVLEAQVHRRSIVARIEECQDRAQAQALKGGSVAVPRSHLPAAADGEYYQADLIGLTVANRQGENFGTVARIMETGANEVLVVQGERERLIPFIAPVVDEADLNAR